MKIRKCLVIISFETHVFHFDNIVLVCFKVDLKFILICTLIMQNLVEVYNCLQI